MAFLGMIVLVGLVLVAAISHHAREWGWWLSFSVVTVTAFALSSYVFYLVPHTGLDLAVTLTVLWAAAGVLYLVLLWRRGFGSWRWEQVYRMRVASILPGLVLVHFLSKLLRTHGHWIAWGMVDDEVQKTVQTLAALRNNGIELGMRVGDPMTVVLNGTFGVWSVHAGGQGEQLQELVRSTEVVSLLMWLLVSVLAALWASRLTIIDRDTFSRRAVWGLSFALGGFIFGWSVSVISYQYGFINIAPGLVLALCCYWAWVHRHRGYGAAVVAQVMGGVALAQMWAPLAVIPAVAAVAMLVEYVGPARRLSGVETPSVKPQLRIRDWVAFGVAAVSALLFLGIVATHAQSEMGLSESLAYNGGFFPYSWEWALVLLVVLALASRQWSAVVLTALLLAVVGLLVLNRLHHDLWGWGYYAIKCMWFAVVLGIITMLPSTLMNARRWLRRPRGVSRPLFAGILALVVVIGLTALAQRPVPRRAISDIPFADQVKELTAISSLPALNEANGTVRWDEAADDLFHILDTNPKSIAIEYLSDEPGVDQNWFLNFWTLQYDMDAHGYQPQADAAFGRNGPIALSDVEAVCGVLTAWQGEGTVWTTQDDVGPKLHAACPTADFDVKVVGPIS